MPIDPEEIFSDAVLRQAAILITSGGSGDLAKIPELPSKINGKGKQGLTLLMFALGVRNKPAIVELLRLGADPAITTDSGVSSIDLAAGADDVDFVIILLDAGADPNSLNEKKEPILFTAASQRRGINLITLLERGADINAVDSGGDTVAHYCAEIDDFEPIPTLLDRGADFRKRNRAGYSLADLVRQSRVQPDSRQGRYRAKVIEILESKGEHFD